MELEPDPVAAELAHHGEARDLHMLLNRMRHVSKVSPGPHGGEPALHRFARHINQALPLRRDLTDREHPR